jgi:hypothetical protein
VPCRRISKRQANRLQGAGQGLLVGWRIETIKVVGDLLRKRMYQIVVPKFKTFPCCQSILDSGSHQPEAHQSQVTPVTEPHTPAKLNML